MAARSSSLPSSFRSCARSPASSPEPIACRGGIFCWRASSARSSGRSFSALPLITFGRQVRTPGGVLVVLVRPKRMDRLRHCRRDRPSSPSPTSCGRHEAQLDRQSRTRPAAGPLRNVPLNSKSGDMTASWSTIDCDVHANVPSMQALLPYLDEHWRDSVVDRGLNSLESISYPPNAPLTARADWRGKAGEPANTLDTLRTHALDRWNIDIAICNCLYGVQLLFSEDMAAAFAKAVNDWVAQGMARSRSAAARLDRRADAEHRLRGRRDRALRRRQALRAGAGACHGRGAARPPAILAGL